jgi:transcriptional regulator with XRE-family HTH domain
VSDVRDFLVREFQDREARLQYASDLLGARLALQIKTIRLQQKLSQEQLAKLAGLHQSQISTMEQISHSSWTISTLQRLAAAFDLALTVDFSSYSDFLDGVLAMGKADLERTRFSDDPGCRMTDNNLLTFPLSESGRYVEVPPPITPIEKVGALG